MEEGDRTKNAAHGLQREAHVSAWASATMAASVAATYRTAVAASSALTVRKHFGRTSSRWPPPCTSNRSRGPCHRPMRTSVPFNVGFARRPTSRAQPPSAGASAGAAAEEDEGSILLQTLCPGCILAGADLTNESLVDSGSPCARAAAKSEVYRLKDARRVRLA